MNKKLLIIALNLILVISCRKDDVLPIEKLPYGTYLKNFDNYAKQNGLDIEDELRGLNFVEIEGSGEGGYCSEFGECSNNIIIPSIYSNYGTNYLEQFIFHQLGHIVLNRTHKDELFSNQEWKSLMRYDPYITAFGQCIDYNIEKREYYLSELFNENINSPSTGLFDLIEYDESLERELVEEEEIFNYGFSETAYFENLQTDDFEIEIALSDIQEIPFWSTFKLSIRVYKAAQNTDRLESVIDLDIFHGESGLTFKDDSYGFYYSYNGNGVDKPSILGKNNLTFHLRKFGEKYLFYIDKHYLFTLHLEEELEFDRIFVSDGIKNFYWIKD